MACVFKLVHCFMLVALVAGHGYLTLPKARQLLLSDTYGVGLRNPGAKECDIAVGNAMNMNGCQGALPISYSCNSECNGQWGSELCKECKTKQFKLHGHAPPRVGVCGGVINKSHPDHDDVFAKVDSKGCENVGTKHPSCVTQALASDQISELTLSPDDNSFDLDMLITAHHWGWSEFRLCTEGAGKGPDGTGVTQECFNQNVLTFDTEDAKKRYPTKNMTDASLPRPGGQSKGNQWKIYNPTSPSDYQGTSAAVRCDGPGIEIKQHLKKEEPDFWSPGGSCCNGGGDCKNSDTDPDQNIRWVFPRPSAATKSKAPSTQGSSGQSMSGIYKVKIQLPDEVRSKCTKEKGPCTIQWLFMTGNSPNSYPEAFRNCADFKLSTSAVSTKLTTSSPSSSSISATSEPEPQPEPVSTAAVTSAPSTSTTSTIVTSTTTTP